MSLIYSYSFGGVADIFQSLIFIPQKVKTSFIVKQSKLVNVKSLLYYA